MKRPLRIGLTGGIASGKTTVAECFLELGVPVVDADQSARRVVEKDTPGLERVVRRFGAAVLKADGTLDRGALRSLIFADTSARKDLEAILHPLIRADMDADVQASDSPYVMLAIPLLVEGGSAKSRVDRLLVVDVPEELQLSRLLARDGGTRAQAKAILSAQASRADRLACADDVLDNSGSIANMRMAVEELHKKYLQIASAPRPESN